MLGARSLPNGTHLTSRYFSLCMDIPDWHLGWEFCANSRGWSTGCGIRKSGNSCLNCHPKDIYIASLRGSSLKPEHSFESKKMAQIFSAPQNQQHSLLHTFGRASPWFMRQITGLRCICWCLILNLSLTEQSRASIDAISFLLAGISSLTIRYNSTSRPDFYSPSSRLHGYERENIEYSTVNWARCESKAAAVQNW